MMKPNAISAVRSSVWCPAPVNRRFVWPCAKPCASWVINLYWAARFQKHWNARKKAKVQIIVIPSTCWAKAHSPPPMPSVIFRPIKMQLPPSAPAARIQIFLRHLRSQSNYRHCIHALKSANANAYSMNWRRVFCNSRSRQNRAA